MDNVCHTREECEAMYAALPVEKKQRAAAKILELLSAEEGAVPKIRALLAEHGKHEWLWHLYDDEIAKLTPAQKRMGLLAVYNPHFSFGMAMRNALRREGFGEEFFDVHNLDDIYIALVEEALELS